MRLLWLAAARDDLEDIWRFGVTRFGESQATDYTLRLFEGARLAAEGHLPGTANDALAEGLRQLVLGSHILYFRRDEETMTVIRVLHHSRDAARVI